jgi:hypothetical protein
LVAALVSNQKDARDVTLTLIAQMQGGGSVVENKKLVLRDVF